ncbi:hypothetical protein JCM11491_002651 [Sporobolomyces phaffii]
MSTDSNTDALPAGFVLTGGIPTKAQDLAASILFFVAYAVLAPFVVLRLARKSSRTLVLVRPAVFLSIRLATYVVRAIQANGNESEGLFIAEQIFLLCGFFLLLEPLSTLVKFNLYRDWIPLGKKDLLERLLQVVRLAIIAAIVLGVVIGSNINAAMSDLDLAEQLRRCRWAAAILALIVIVVSLLLTLYGQATGVSDLRRTGYLGAVATCLLVPSVYKLVSYADPAHPFSPAGKAVFYVLYALPELVAVALYVSINLEATFDIKEGTAKEKWNHKAHKGKVTGSYVSPYETAGDRHYEMAKKYQV